jgi:hypothetical protein
VGIWNWKKDDGFSRLDMATFVWQTIVCWNFEGWGDSMEHFRRSLRSLRASINLWRVTSGGLGNGAEGDPRTLGLVWNVINWSDMLFVTLWYPLVISRSALENHHF